MGPTEPLPRLPLPQEPAVSFCSGDTQPYSSSCAQAGVSLGSAQILQKTSSIAESLVLDAICDADGVLSRSTPRGFRRPDL